MKKALALTLILVLLMSAVAGTQFARVGKADAWEYTGEEPADAFTNPPTVIIQFPEKNKTYTVNNVSLTFNVRVGDSTTASYPIITEVYYETDWQQGITIVHSSDWRGPDAYFYGFESKDFSFNLTGVPEGNHSITIHATEHGTYYRALYRASSFTINGSSSVSFTIDTPPSVQVLSPRIETYNTTSIPLNFVLNESVAQISYSLDGKENVTVAGNTTLTMSHNGAHNVTLYARDNYGNIGNSETITFTVEEPEPELFPTAYSMGIVAVIVLVLLGSTVYILKRKHTN